MQQHSVCFTFGQNNELLRGEKGAKLSLPPLGNAPKKIFCMEVFPYILRFSLKPHNEEETLNM